MLDKLRYVVMFAAIAAMFELVIFPGSWALWYALH